MRDDFNIADEFAALVAAKVVDILEERGLVMAAPEPKKVATSETPLYPIDEVCARLKISKPTLKVHRRKGLISPSGGYVGRSPRFTEEDIAKYLSHYKDG